MKTEKNSFLKDMLTLAVPISLQNLIQSLLGMVDQIMIGRLGTKTVAAVSLAGRPSFIMIFALGGIASASSIFASQYEGAKDSNKHANIMRISLISALGVCGLFFVFSLFTPELILSFFTKDAKVIEIGKDYLRINSLSYCALAAVICASAMLRSTGFANITLAAGLAAVAINTTLNAFLIFGLMGFPALGAIGASIATVISTYIECIILIVFMAIKKHPAQLKAALHCKNEISFLKKFFITALPAVCTELLWAVGDAGYSAIYGHMGTSELAAITLTFPVQGLTTGFFSGLSAATGILIGNELGSNNFKSAYRLSWKFIKISIPGCILIGLLIASLAPVYTGFFNVEPQVRKYANTLLMIFAFYLWIKVSNMIIGSGILRSGGKTKFTLFLDTIGTYGIGLPLGLIGAVVLKLEITKVYALLSVEEIIRLAIGLERIKSKKWMSSLTQQETKTLEEK
ncbi:MATE family efflux transporter [Treponema sp.]|uniref:MATE family efflux transporter n=1 Tax=Treponema sp. TaxID=166 RepID=UPI003F045E36